MASSAQPIADCGMAELVAVMPIAAGASTSLLRSLKFALDQLSSSAPSAAAPADVSGARCAASAATEG